MGYGTGLETHTIIVPQIEYGKFKEYYLALKYVLLDKLTTHYLHITIEIFLIMKLFRFLLSSYFILRLKTNNISNWVTSKQKNYQSKVRVVIFNWIKTHYWNCSHNTIISISIFPIFYTQTQNILYMELSHIKKKILIKGKNGAPKDQEFVDFFDIAKEVKPLR